ncbi:karyopherin (importin) beta 3 [Anaeramoeba flamelloides]|uniref:Karyopherin (Importin) beta 3 n=1 Tax=Anaeramoeba flamelloides TaxID=1746091 RepID=A0ABQ8YXC6_9EUKA|nr:karyopherin (importin) beta 3 [Anaeramoeba flamelloides]
MNENLTEFEDLVKRLLLPDNTIRGKAEEQYYTYLTEDTDSCLKFLLSMLNFSETPEVIAISLVLLRRNVVSEFNPFWSKSSKETQNIIHQSLFEEYSKQKRFYFKKLIADILIAIDKKSMNENEEKKSIDNEEFLIFLFKAIENNSELELQTFMYIIKEMCTYNPQLLVTKVERLSELFSNCLSNEVNLNIRSVTVVTICSFIPLLENENQEEYNILIPLMIEVLWALIENGDEDLAENCLKSIVQLASRTIKPFKKQIKLILEHMLKINETENEKFEIDMSLKLLAVELLITFIETASGVVVETEGFLTRLIQCGIQLITNIDENEEIDDFDNTKEIIAEEISPVSKGESILDRISLQLGGEMIVKDIFKLIPDLLGSEFWNYRFAGLRTLEYISEGCRKTMLPELGNIVELVLPLLSDSNFRVCYQAVDTIQEFSVEFCPFLQSNYSNLILPKLIKLFDSNSYLMKANVCACLTKYLQKIANPEPIIDFIPDIMDNLLKVFENTNFNNQSKEELIIQEQAISTIAAMSIALKTDFLGYYDHIMKLSKAILKEATLDEQRLLCGKTIDCVALIGRATGHENFENDANEVMKIMIDSQENSEINSDDPKLPYILKAWAQIAVVLKEKFVPYLEVLMPLIWEQAGQQIDLIVVDELDTQAQEALIGREVIVFGDKLIGINTTVLISISKALELCYSLVHVLGHHFIQYVDKTLEIVLHLTPCIYDQKIRYYCSSLIPELFNSIIVALKLKTINNLDKNVLDHFFNESIKELYNAVMSEEKQDILSSQLEAISDLIEYYGKEGIDEQNIPIIIEVIVSEIKDSVQRRELLIQKTIEGEKYVDESGLSGDIILQQDLQEENEIFEALTQIISNLAQNCYQFFYPHFEKLIFPFFNILIKVGNHPINSQYSFSALSSIILYCEQNLFQFYWEIIKENALEWMQQTEQTGVIQAAAFAIGVCAQRAGSDQLFKKDAPEIAKFIIQALQTISELEIDEDVILAKEHLISALGKICFYHAQTVPFNELAPVWLQSLPIEQDHKEAQWSIKSLIKYIEDSNNVILGENNQNLAKIFQILTFSADTDLLNKEVDDQILKLFRQFKNEYQPNQIESLIQDFEQELKEKFVEIWEKL